MILQLILRQTFCCTKEDNLSTCIYQPQPINSILLPFFLHAHLLYLTEAYYRYYREQWGIDHVWVVWTVERATGPLLYGPIASSQSQTHPHGSPTYTLMNQLYTPLGSTTYTPMDQLHTPLWISYIHLYGSATYTPWINCIHLCESTTYTPIDQLLTPSWINHIHSCGSTTYCPIDQLDTPLWINHIHPYGSTTYTPMDKMT